MWAPQPAAAPEPRGPGRALRAAARRGRHRPRPGGSRGRVGLHDQQLARGKKKESDLHFASPGRHRAPRRDHLPAGPHEGGDDAVHRFQGPSVTRVPRQASGAGGRAHDGPLSPTLSLEGLAPRALLQPHNRSVAMVPPTQGMASDLSMRHVTGTSPWRLARAGLGQVST